MAEKSYIGYKATPGIDWGKLTSEFSQGLLAIGERRAAQNIYFDNLYKENMNAVKEVERSNDQDLNTIIQGAMSQVKDNAFDMNNLVKSGSMNHNEYRNFVNNTNNSITSFAKTAKGLDATIQENIKRQQLDENGKPQGSEYEEYLTESYSKLLDLRNKTMYQDPQTGKMFLATLGPDGLADMNTIQDASALNKPMNIRDNYVDYNQVINNKIKTFGEIKIEERLPDGSTITRSGISKMVDVKDKDGKVIGQRQALNKNVSDGIATTQNEITSNPRSTYNILKMMDDRFDSYQDDEEYRSKMSRLIDIENQSRVNQGQPAMNESETERYVSEADMFMIPSSPDSKSELQPQPSADQVQMAKDWIKDTFYMQMDYSETLKAAPSKNKVGGGSKSGSGITSAEADILYEQIRGAWDMIGTNNAEAVAILESQATDGSKFTVKDDGYLYKLEQMKEYDPREGKEVTKERLVGPIKNLQNISKSFFGATTGKGSPGANKLYRGAEDRYMKKTGKEKAIMAAMMEEEIQQAPEEQPRRGFFSRFLPGNNVT